MINTFVGVAFDPNTVSNSNPIFIVSATSGRTEGSIACTGDIEGDCEDSPAGEDMAFSGVISISGLKFSYKNLQIIKSNTAVSQMTSFGILKTFESFNSPKLKHKKKSAKLVSSVESQQRVRELKIIEGFFLLRCPSWEVNK